MSARCRHCDRRNSGLTPTARLGVAALLFCVSTLFAQEPNLAESKANVAVPEIAETPISATDRDHWAFEPLKTPSLPDVKDATWCRTPIDRFILAKLEEDGLTPMPAASRRTLLRRVMFDVTGLPPSPAQIDAFLADTRPDAWEQFIDELLDSPAYGERWAQHWLDLARFAETDGFEHDLERPNAWRYRDWVIAAFNRDLPYDEFLRLQLAGDELAPDDPAAHIATAFLLSGPDMPDLNDQGERRHVVLNDMTATLGSVVMGLQMGCAQCHDHKYDPVSQADFYRLRAFFEPAEFFKEHALPNAGEKTTSRTLQEKSGKPADSRLMVRGDHRRPGGKLSPAYLRVVNFENHSVAPPRPDAKSTGQRAQLAEWLTRPDHPLTARVLVNRIWQQHFGRGLSSTPSDFGIMGDTPTHSELLDWLAATFVAPVEDGGCGWSLKRLHRLILTSATWQQASKPTDADWSAEATAAALPVWERALEKDPENRLWSRTSRTRLDGEVIRDALLATSGNLSDRRGGPGVRPSLPAELVATLLKNQWVVSPDPVDHRRRSVYLFARRNLRYPIFEAFDRPDANASCARRTRSTIAPQALFLLNSELTLSAARDLAAVVANAGEPSARVDAAWMRTFGRLPTSPERATAIAFLGDGAREKLVDLCLALYNANEFVYVD